MATEMSLRAEEVGFLFLTRGHRLLCPVLQRLMTNAMRKCYPQDWQRKICSCFGKGTFESVRRRLESGEEIRDIFVVCEVIRCYLRSVFRVATASGEQEDYRRTEFLSSALQAVGETRHWVFHQKGAYPAEIASSLAYSGTALELLAGPETGVEKWAAEQCKEQLCQSREDMDRFLEGRWSHDDHFEISLVEGAEILLQRCLKHLEESLERFIRSVLPAEASTASSCDHDTHKSSVKTGLNLWLRRLKDSHHEAAVRQYKVRGVGVNVGRVCYTLMRVRNSFAHGGITCLVQLREDMERSMPLWKAFQFDKSLAAALLDYLPPFSKESGQLRDSSASVQVSIDAQSVALWKVPVVRRTARETDRIFVGRSAELQECVAFFINSESQQRAAGKLLIIEGVSGVGKTALAKRSMETLADHYQRQLWLSSSSLDVLTTDLHMQLPLCWQLRKHHKLSTEELATITAKHLRTFPKHLIVFDNITKEVAGFFATLVCHTHHSIIVTSCHHSNLPLDKISKTIPFVHCQPIGCLTTKHSMQLVESRGIAIAGNEGMIRKVLAEHLENLPLAINLFCSLVNCKLAEKGKMKMSEDRNQPLGSSLDKRQSPKMKEKTTQPTMTAKSELLRVVLCSVQSSLHDELIKLARRTADRYHVRGVVGLVSIALECLVRELPALCLLLLTTLVFQQGLIWEMFSLPGECSLASAGISDKEEDLCVFSAVASLYDASPEIRNQAGERLLQLGLVTWDAADHVLKMHDLVQACVIQEVLSGSESLSGWLQPDNLVMLVAMISASHFMTTCCEDLRSLIVFFTLLSRPQLACLGVGLKQLFTSDHLYKRNSKLRHLSWKMPLILAHFYNVHTCVIGRHDPSALILESFTDFVACNGFIPVRGISVLKKWYVAGHWASENFVSVYSIFALVRLLTNKHWPKCTAPMNLFTFIGTSCMMQDTDDTNQSSATDTALDSDSTCKLTGHNPTLDECHWAVLLVSGLSDAFQRLLTNNRPWSHTHSENLGPQFGMVCKSPEAVEKTAAMAGKVHFTVELLELEVKHLLRRKAFGRLARLFIEEEQSIMARRWSASNRCGEERRKHCELVLVGAICFSIVGLYNKACTWTNWVLENLGDEELAGSALARRYRTISLAILAHIALVQDELDCCMHFLEMSMDSADTEVAKTESGSKFVEQTLLLVMVCEEFEQVLVVLGFMLDRFEFDNSLRPDRFNLSLKGWPKLTPPTTTPHPSPFGIFSQVIVPLLASMMYGNPYRDLLVKFGTLYRLARRRLLTAKGKSSRSKELCLHCIACWFELTGKFPFFCDFEQPEGQAMIMLLMHLLLSLARLYEHEERWHEALWFYRSVRKVEKIVLIDQHMHCYTTLKDLARVLRQLGQAGEANEVEASAVRIEEYYFAGSSQQHEK